MYPVTLTGEFTTIREFGPGDLAAVLAVFGDERVTNSLSSPAKNREAAATMLEKVLSGAHDEPRLEYYLAVTVRPDVVAGFVRLGLNPATTPEGKPTAAKFGGAGSVDYWRQGLGRDAALTMLRFGFETLGLHRITAAVGPQNARSHRLIASLGFTREGVLRDHVHNGRGWRDSVLYSMLAPEWQAIQAGPNGRALQLQPTKATTRGTRSTSPLDATGETLNGGTQISASTTLGVQRRQH